MSTRGIVIVMCVGVASAPDPSRAKCAMQELAPELWTPNGAQLPPDGGVVVGWTYETHGAKPKGDPSQPDWLFSVPTKQVTLVPGVTVYVPKSRDGALKVTDQRTNEIATFTFDSHAPTVKMAAPVAKEIHLVHGQSRRQRTTTVTAEVADAPPAAAIGVITYAKGKAIDFARVEKDEAAGKNIALHRDPGRCRFPPPGLEAPPPGAQVTFAYVDAFGRVGAQSKPVKVVEDPDLSGRE